MKPNAKLWAAAVAAACVAPAAALAQQPSTPVQGELVVITITPVEQRVMDEQRREALFRALDANGDGQVSMAEAGVNTQLVDAFQRLDRNANRSIDRQEFTSVHVDDGSQQAAARGQPQSAAGGASGPSTSPTIDERAKGYGPQRSEQAGAGGGSSTVERAPIPSSSIEERSKFSIPGGR